MNSALTELTFRCRSLLSLPTVYQKISMKIDQPQTTNNELAEIVKMDPGVASKLLATVNSSFYGFSGKIASVPHAISIVGLNDFQNLVLSASLVQMFQQLKETEFSMEEFWHHSLLCAILAKTLGARINKRSEQESLFIAGLLHDIGKLAIIQTTDKDESTLISLWEERLPAKEQQILGYDHAQAGAALLESWELPSSLIESAGQHHQSEIESPIARTVAISNLIAINQLEQASRRLEGIVQDETITLEELTEIRNQAESELGSLISTYLN